MSEPIKLTIHEQQLWRMYFDQCFIQPAQGLLPHPKRAVQVLDAAAAARQADRAILEIRKRVGKPA